jgi:uncharacterized protein (TIGR03437 family)
LVFEVTVTALVRHCKIVSGGFFAEILREAQTSKQKGISMKSALLVLLLMIAAGLPAGAQCVGLDNGGNNLLLGKYYFRHVIYQVADNAGDLGRAIALYGNINFAGDGTYTITGSSILDSGVGAVQTFSASGTYSISATGYGYISSAVTNNTDCIYGLVANGIFVGSSTETQIGYNDLFIAAQLSSPAPSNSTFKGNYSVAYMNFADGNVLNTYDALLQLNPDGNGNLGTVNFTGYVGNGTTPFNLSESSVKYFFSNGAAVVTFPNSSNAAIVGQEYLYFSPDGNFVFGGAPNGFDMLLGVRPGTSPTLSGLYYQAGLESDESTLASGFATMDTFYGSLSANAGTIVGHQRFLTGFSTAPVGFTYRGTYAVNANGTYDDSVTSTHYIVGPSGAVRIGFGLGPFLGITVAVQAPGVSGSGVFLNPAGVVNAASSAPFTAGIVRGEFITLYGSNLAPNTQTATTAPFPPALNGVQVLINNAPAPLYFVSQNQISAIVPFGTTTATAQIQVINNGMSSNVVTTFVNQTSPGVFTVPPGGIGYGAALHPDFSLVTTAHPAQIGEIIAVYLTGLGDVTPPVTDGALGPSNPPSLATNNITARIGGIQATVNYAGLAPQLAGLYQVNITIPSGVSAGDNALDIAGPDSFTSEAVISIGTGSVSAPAEKKNR